MTKAQHPISSEHLPAFIAAPGETDVLMVLMGAFLLLFALAFGVLFFRLHCLPDHIAHKSQKVQFEIVAVLGLLAMFTHIHLFWIAALLLALVDLPDFGSFLDRIVRSVEKISRAKQGPIPPKVVVPSVFPGDARLDGKESGIDRITE